MASGLPAQAPQAIGELRVDAPSPAREDFDDFAIGPQRGNQVYLGRRRRQTAQCTRACREI